MSDRPIIFSGPMVRAILDGRKTQTRRVLTRPSWAQERGWPENIMNEQDLDGKLRWFCKDTGCLSLLPIPQIGDRLYVREAWNITHRQHLAPGEDIERSAEDCVAANGGFACACADGVVYQATAAQSHPEYGKSLWRPSIHMPRWASRLTLIVEDVLVQRVQEISEKDARAEGAYPCENGWSFGGSPLAGSTARGAYYCLWNSLNAKRGYAWDTNPWVVALTFHAIKKNIDEVKADE